MYPNLVLRKSENLPSLVEVDFVNLSYRTAAQTAESDSAVCSISCVHTNLYNFFTCTRAFVRFRQIRCLRCWARKRIDNTPSEACDLMIGGAGVNPVARPNRFSRVVPVQIRIVNNRRSTRNTASDVEWLQKKIDLSAAASKESRSSSTCFRWTRRLQSASSV